MGFAKRGNMGKSGGGKGHGGKNAGNKFGAKKGNVDINTTYGFLYFNFY